MITVTLSVEQNNGRGTVCHKHKQQRAQTRKKRWYVPRHGDIVDGPILLASGKEVQERRNMSERIVAPQYLWSAVVTPFFKRVYIAGRRKLWGDTQKHDEGIIIKAEKFQLFNDEYNEIS